MIFDRRNEARQKRFDTNKAARELRKQYRIERRNRKFAEGGVVYPSRFKLNRRRILLLTMLRKK